VAVAFEAVLVVHETREPDWCVDRP